MPVRIPTRQVSTFLGLASSQALAGLGLLMLGKRLTAPEFGSYATISVAAISVSSFLDAGSSTVQIRRVAQGGNPAILYSWLGKRTIRQFVPAVLLGIALVQTVGGKIPTASLVFLLSQMCTHTFSMGTLSVIRGKGRAALAGWLTALGNAIFFAATVFSPRSSLLVCAALAATISWVITGVSALVVSRNLLRPPVKWEGNPWRETGGFVGLTFASALAGFELLALKMGIGSQKTASYAAVSTWTQPILLIMYAYTASMFADFSSSATFTDAYALMRSSRADILATCALLMLLAASAPILVSRLFGSKYPDAANLLIILAIASTFVAWTQPYLSILQARGDERYVAILYGGVTALRLALIVGGGSLLGPQVAPLTLIVSSVALIALLRRRCKQLIRSSAIGREPVL